MILSIFRTVLIIVTFWISLILCQFLSLSYWILDKMNLPRERSLWMAFSASRWVDLFLILSGSRLTVMGRENIPEDHSYCIVSNHQGYFDIPVILRTIPWSVGFISKKELEHVPFLASLMRASSVVFLDRKDRRKAMDAMMVASERIKAGQPMAIFPEGTRSRGPKVNQFKGGALKLATLAKTKILPVTINGTYQMIEDTTRWGINPAKIAVQYHPVVDTAKLSESEISALPERLRHIIAAPIEGVHA